MSVTTGISPSVNQPLHLSAVGPLTDEYLDHAKVLAMIDAANEITQKPVRWTMVVQLMTEVDAYDPPLRLAGPRAPYKDRLLMDRVVCDAIRDFERLHVVDNDANGSQVVSSKLADAWGQDYEDLRFEAIAFLNRRIKAMSEFKRIIIGG